MKMLEIIEYEQSVHLSVLSNEQKQKAKIVIERLNFIENIEGDNVTSKQTNTQKVEISVSENASIAGGIIVADSIKNSFNKVVSSDIPNELKEFLKELSIAVDKMGKELSKDKVDDLADDLEMLINQASQEKPKRKWWAVSIDGLTKAAKNVGKNGQSVLELLGKIVPILDVIST